MGFTTRSHGVAIWPSINKHLASASSSKLNPLLKPSLGNALLGLWKQLLKAQLTANWESLL